MAKRAKAPGPSKPEREARIVKVDEPSIVAPVALEAKPKAPPAPPIVPPRAPSGPSFGERVGRFFRFLLRVVTLLIILALVSLVLYLVVPWLYQKFITPVEQNTAQIRELQSQQKQMEQDVADLQTKLGTIESVQNGHDGSLTELDKRVSDIETEINARTESLAALEDMQSELQAQNEANSAELERQINLLKSMELLSRARLFMYQSNFGSARRDVQIARDLIVKVQPDVPVNASLANELDEVIRRLDLTLSNLPDFPVAASDDLNIAWQILLSGLPEATPTLSETLTPTGTLSATPSALATLTPTLRATVVPSATP